MPSNQTKPNQTKPNYASEINKMSRFTERTDIILGNGLTQQAEFKFLMRLYAFHFVLKTL